MLKTASFLHHGGNFHIACDNSDEHEVTWIVLFFSVHFVISPFSGRKQPLNQVLRFYAHKRCAREMIRISLNNVVVDVDDFWANICLAAIWFLHVCKSNAVFSSSVINLQVFDGEFNKLRYNSLVQLALKRMSKPLKTTKNKWDLYNGIFHKRQKAGDLFAWMHKLL